MKKLAMYRVDVCRIAYGNNDIEVEAIDEKEARRKAVDLAPNLDFGTHDVEYKPQTVTCISKANWLVSIYKGKTPKKFILKDCTELEASLKIESMLKPLTRWKAQRTQREEL
jgi:hypothetical protein